MSASFPASTLFRCPQLRAPNLGIYETNWIADSMMRLKSALVAKALMVSAALLAGQAARAQDLGTIRAGNTLILPLNANDLAGQVAVEIDGVDITDFVTIQNGQIVIGSGVPLTAGQHEIIVYTFSDTGYAVAATYSFSTDSSTGGTGASTTFTATHEIGGRSVNGKGEGFANSAGELRVETLDTRITGWVNYLATTRKSEQIEGKPFNIGEYSIQLSQSGELLNLIGQLGHQTLSYDRALVSNISRRGLSVAATGPSERLELALFGLKTSEILGAKNILGLDRKDDRMFGGRIAFRPFLTSDLRFSIQAYEGQGIPSVGLLTGTGSGHSVALDGTALDNRLRYAAAFAQTAWDPDSGGFLPEEEGNAFLSSLDYELLTGDNGRYLTLGFDYELVDITYYSLANPELPIGGETIRVTADYVADRFTLLGTAETKKTNIGGPENEPTDRINKLAVDMTYAPTWGGFFHNTDLRFGADYKWQERLKTPIAAPPPADWQATTLYLGLEKTTEFTAWGIQYTYIDEEDEGPANLDSNSHALETWFDRSVSDDLSLTGSLSSTHFKTPSTGAYWRHEGKLGVNYDIDPGQWNLTLDMGLTETDEPGVESGHYAAGNATWNFNPGADLVFSAGYYDGAYATESGQDHDAIVGVLLRLRTNLFR